MAAYVLHKIYIITKVPYIMNMNVSKLSKFSNSFLLLRNKSLSLGLIYDQDSKAES